MAERRTSRLSGKPADEPIKKETLAAYFIADMDNLSKRALQMEQTQTTKVNFYLVIVTGVIGALLAASTVETIHPYVLQVAFLVLLFLHILGWLILYQDMDLTISITILYRRVSRMRVWFLDQKPDILPYMPFSTGDDRPLVFVPHMPLRGVEMVLLFVNAVLGGLFAGLGWMLLDGYLFHLPFRQSYLSALIAVGSGLIVTLLLWWAETLYAKAFMKRKDRVQQKEGLIHFPVEEVMKKYTQDGNKSTLS